MLPEQFPEINIFWKNVKKDSEGYKKAFAKMLYGQLSQVGEETVGIVEISSLNRVVPIAVFPSYSNVWTDFSVRFSSYSLITDSYLPVIFLEPIYFKAMQTKPVHKANIYHEIGHGFMGHANRDPNNLKMISEGRAEAQSKGEVFWQEREADAFACHYVGKKAMLQHLQGIKQIAKTIAGSDPGFRVNLPTHINELDKRIRLIQDNNNF